MRLTQRIVSWVAWEEEVLLFFKARRWDFLNFSRTYSFGGVGWGVWRKQMRMCFFCLFFFCDMVT
jgi:hypothetical protein